MNAALQLEFPDQRWQLTCDQFLNATLLSAVVMVYLAEAACDLDI